MLPARTKGSEKVKWESLIRRKKPLRPRPIAKKTGQRIFVILVTPDRSAGKTSRFIRGLRESDWQRQNRHISKVMLIVRLFVNAIRISKIFDGRSVYIVPKGPSF